MGKLVIPAPDPREGDRLGVAIETATGYPARVGLHGDQWEIDTDAAEADVQAIVDAHDGTPEPPSLSTEDRIAALEEDIRGMKERVAAEDVTNVDAIKVRDAIVGKGVLPEV